jgi:hypothetical protein
MRHAFRRAARNPGFACAAVTTLALGIGASTAMFSVVHSVLLRPLPYPAPDQLVRVYLASPERGVQLGALSLPDLRDWQEQSSVFSSLAGYFSFKRNLTGSGDPASLRTTYVSQYLDSEPLSVEKRVRILTQLAPTRRTEARLASPEAPSVPAALARVATRFQHSPFA